MQMSNIIKLNINDFYKCNNIWDVNKKKQLADKFYSEIESGNRITFVYTEQDEIMMKFL